MTSLGYCMSIQLLDTGFILELVSQIFCFFGQKHISISATAKSFQLLIF